MSSTKKEIDHSGSSFDEFLREEGVLEETEAIAIKRVIAWQLQTEMRRKHITKKAMADQLGTSRSQVDRLLDPTHAGVTLGTLAKAARALGKRLKVQVIDQKAASQVRVSKHHRGGLRLGVAAVRERKIAAAK
jgi:DNA-binding Xre family transcriptional regulator